MKIILLLIALPSFLLIGCSAHRSSINEGVSESAIYELDEKQVFNLVYSSIQEVFPQEKISVITTPARGYITKFLAPPFNIDWFTQKVLVHRASGENKDGNKVYGYWIEVTGSGSSFLQGQLKNEEVFDKIISYLENSSKKHIVSNISVSPYLVSQEQFYVRGADTLEGDGARIVITNGNNSNDNKSQADQLRELHKLYNDGILTKDEYETAKKKVLNKY